MSKLAKTHSVHVSPVVQKKAQGSFFVQLAKKHITKIGTEEAKTVSRDIDSILYGRKSVSPR